MSAIVFVGAVAYFIIAKSRGEREDVAALRGTTEVPGEPQEAAEEAAEDKSVTDVAEDGSEDDVAEKDKKNSPESVKPE